MNENLRKTLRSWPVVTALTIGLCYLTQATAEMLGVKLPDQANLDLVRKYIGWNKTFMLLCAQVLVVMPALEEIIFRWLLFMLPARIAAKHAGGRAMDDARRPVSVFRIAFCILSSALFSSAHYIAQPFPDAAFIALFFFGLAQCWLYTRTGRIWCTMLNHFLFNLTNIVLLAMLPPK